MIIYEFFWSWYEDYVPHLLLHKENKTKQEFEKDCINALKIVGKEYIEKETSWVGAHRWIKNAVEYMYKNMGYEKPNIINFGHFGSYIIEHNTENKLKEDDTEWKKLVGKDLFKKASEKNKKIDKELY